MSELREDHGRVLIRVKGDYELKQCYKSEYTDLDGEEYVVENYGDYYETIHLMRNCVGWIKTPLVTNLKTKEVVFL